MSIVEGTNSIASRATNTGKVKDNLGHENWSGVESQVRCGNELGRSGLLSTTHQNSSVPMIPFPEE